MPRTPTPTSLARRSYWEVTLHPLNCLLFILPGLLFFQIGSTFCGTSLFATRHLGKVLEYLGATGRYLPGLLIVAVLLIQHLVRRDPWKVRPHVLSGMFGESVLWAAPLVGAYYLTGMLLVAQTNENSTNLLRDLLNAVGAGIYEEFLFRVVLISLVMLIFVDIFELKKDAVTVAAVLVAGLAFSLYHLSRGQIFGELAFPWRDFLFRGLAGTYLGALFVFRGFGITVGTHITYNLFALISAAQNA